MTDDPHLHHALFIRWGKFQAGAFGLPALMTLAIMAICAVVGKWLGAW